ncbi:MAG: hypothetical protein V1767_07690 [Chloroflexota bacterium]
MVRTESLSFRFDVSFVVRVVSGDFLPVAAEVALDAVLPFEFEVGLLDLFQQGGDEPRIKTR